MSKDDLINIGGRVLEISGGGKYQVELENGVQISTRLCGKMKKFNIKVVVGDSVNVGVSPYDPSHGLILFRHK